MMICMEQGLFTLLGDDSRGRAKEEEGLDGISRGKDVSIAL